MSQIVRIQDDVYERAKILSELQNETLSSFMTKAICSYEKQLFFSQLQDSYRDLSSQERDEELLEQKELDGTLGDGIDD